MTRKVCNVPGCGTLTNHGNRCPEHRTPDHRGSRGYSLATWQQARDAYLRSHPFCEHTEYTIDWRVTHCTNLATDVDHIDGLGPRGPRGADPDNLRAYCHHHHSQRTARDHKPGSRQTRGVA